MTARGRRHDRSGYCRAAKPAIAIAVSSVGHPGE